jgi:hypothetical protein
MKPFKKCTFCGVEYTAEAWEKLPYVGEMADAEEAVELRNCPACKTTIGVGKRLYRYCVTETVSGGTWTTQHYGSSMRAILHKLAKKGNTNDTTHLVIYRDPSHQLSGGDGQNVSVECRRLVYSSARKLHRLTDGFMDLRAKKIAETIADELNAQLREVAEKNGIPPGLLSCHVVFDREERAVRLRLSDRLSEIAMSGGSENNG